MIKTGHSAGVSRRADLLAIGGLVLLAMGVPLLVSLLAGTTQVPRNDDWSYRHIAVAMESTGRMILDGISETMIVGQILITQPLLWVFGPRLAFTLAGAGFGVAGILGAYAVARQILSTRDAAIAAGTLAVFPGYLAYATSYMSDVPALGAQLFCLAAGAAALKSRPVRTSWLVASAVIGVFAFSIREFAIAAPACVFIAAIIAEPGRMRHWALGALVVACCVGIHVWRSLLPGQLPPVAPGPLSISSSILALSSVAFVVSPVAILGAIRWRSQVQRMDLIIGFEIGLILVGVRVVQWVGGNGMPTMFLDNLASQLGVPAGGYIIGGRPLLFSEPVWAGLNLLALLASVIVLAIGTGIAGAHFRRCHRSGRAMITRIGSPAGILVLFCLVVVGGLVFFGLSRNIYDRYYWPLVPPLAALFLFLPRDLARMPASPRRPSDTVLMASAIAIAAALAAMSVIYLLNSHAFDAARWRAGEQLVNAGIPADEIDAGYEWVGYHASSQGDPTINMVSNPFYRTWWPRFKECGVVSSAAIAPQNGTLVGTTTYQLHLVTGPTETLYLYRVGSPECMAE